MRQKLGIHFNPSKSRIVYFQPSKNPRKSWGHPNHIDLTLDQLFGWRPPGIAGYRTEVPWLYLTGAGTFPGGGVSGLPGRNAARAVLADVGARPRRASRLRRELRGLWDAFGLYREMRRGS